MYVRICTDGQVGGVLGPLRRAAGVRNGSRIVKGVGRGSTGNADDMLETGETDRVDLLAVEKVDEYRLKLHKSGVCIEQLRCEVHQWLVPWSRFGV